ncbi:MAG: sulfatase-like hydrolase/transferase [Deltaproteobacteria bacterium]|nr:sulfatase-like hydrolase/transferase [Deltaproteobacteria bacterium]MBW2413495.1 sulfatase-like hydrolase/transferase [Deltaproteobacteria bacterium]
MPSRPNLLIFMPDQLRADCTGAFGNAAVQTPNIDALAARGVRFGNAFSQHSVCSPSRASLFTGWYPHVTGHRTLTHLLRPWEPNLLKLLRDSGYHVAWAGQRGDTFAPGMTQASTDEWGFRVRPEGRFHDCPWPQDHKFARTFYYGRRETDGAGGVALDFDEAAVQTAEQMLGDGMPEPWCLFVALIFPHPPFHVEEPWFSMHSRSDVPLPVDTDLERKPAFMREIRRQYGTDRLDDDDWREIVATYYGMISRVDAQLGRMLQAVERTGGESRTVTAFFTDHGEYLGDYGLIEKFPSGLDDCLLRNPLIVAGPDTRQGAECGALVELVDLLPSFLELAGTEATHTHFGRSLVPLLSDPAGAHRDAAFSEGGFTDRETHLLEHSPFPYDLKAGIQHQDPVYAGKAVSMRTRDWTYIHRLYEDNELYDRAADPRECHNRSGEPALQGLEIELRDRVLDWMIATSDVIPWDADPRFTTHQREREAGL